LAHCEVWRESDTRWGEQSLYPTPGAAEFSDSGS
jgi:hypothetical protein